MNYYNEYDKKAAAWLRELIKAGLIPAGDVDERSIVDVQPQDLDGYTQCHFFAGIGGWSLALQLAGWDGPVWTGSCPCQPFSSAGKGKGTDDERHLWPEFARLIGECKPATVFGEQVASKAGREWFDGVSTDLEDMDYAAAAADLCAAGVNAPHIRQRLFWAADSGREQLCRNARAVRPEKAERDSKRELNGCEHLDAGDGGEVHCGLADTKGGERGLPVRGCEKDEVLEPVGCCKAHGRLGDAINPRLEGYRRSKPVDDSQGRQDADGHSAASSQWHNFDIIRCVEPTKEPGRYVEKRRRVESGTLPLAHGIPGRVGLLRGYGNAIVPQVAAEFIQAYMTI